MIVVATNLLRHDVRLRRSGPKRNDQAERCEDPDRFHDPIEELRVSSRGETLRDLDDAAGGAPEQREHDARARKGARPAAGSPHRGQQEQQGRREVRQPVPDLVGVPEPTHPGWGESGREHQRQRGGERGENPQQEVQA